MTHDHICCFMDHKSIVRTASTFKTAQYTRGLQLKNPIIYNHRTEFVIIMQVHASEFQKDAVMRCEYASGITARAV